MGSKPYVITKEIESLLSDKLHSEVIDDAVQEVNNLLAFIRRMAAISQELNREVETAKNRVTEIENELPHLLAAVALGEKEPAEVQAAKDELAKLKERIADASLIFAGLETRDKQALARIQQVKREVLTKVDAYRKYCQEAATGTYDKALSFAEDLARHLGLEQHLRVLRAELEKQRAA